jgi:signal transduction histidine kinase
LTAAQHDTRDYPGAYVEARRDKQTATRLGKLIAECRPQIEQRWLERVERDLLAGRSGVEPTHLRDGLPDYLDALAALFQQPGEHRYLLAGEPTWSKIAREHGVTRVRLGFDINQLVHEFIILRQTIRELVVEKGGSDDRVEAVLADALDAAIAASVSSYVDARDYQTRQKQAENIGFLTHELRNPLSAATLSAAHLRQVSTPEQGLQLDALDRSLQRLTALIDGVLLTERLESGKIQSRTTEVQLGQIMEPALEVARNTAAKKGLDFRARFDPAVSLRVDPELTQSAVQNLADNAARYADIGYVEVSVEDLPDEVVFHVRDTCTGISSEELRTIFEPFERGTTGKSGTGLGLAIAKRAVEAQGGSIHAESPGHSGCHFWIELPKRPLPTQSART